MKLLFVYPHTLGHGDIPIALTVLSAVVRKAGHEVQVFDCSFYSNEQYVKNIKESYGMVKAAAKPPVEPPVTKKMSDIEKDFSDVIRKYKPDLVGVTATTAIYPLGRDCCAMVKKIDPKIKTIIGGVHATLCPDEVIMERSVDMICIGEGEEALVELCAAIEKKQDYTTIKNLWVRDPNNPEQIVKNELRPFLNMDTLPPQDFDPFCEYSLYRPFDGNYYRMLHTEISRGCVFNCSFCVNHSLKEILKSCGLYHRKKSPKVAVEQLKTLKVKYGFNFIRFWDEDFTGHPLEFIKTFAPLYKKEVNLPFLVYADTRSITQEKVQHLKDMGCVTMAIGIESGSDWLRKYVLNRNIANDEIIRKFDIVKASGIRVSTYNMIGLPFETREMVFETIKLNRRVNPAATTVGPFKPFPKTRLAQVAIQYGMVQKEPDFLLLESEMRTPYMEAKEIDGLVRTFSFYVKAPEKMFPVLEACEKDPALAGQILPHLRFDNG